MKTSKVEEKIDKAKAVEQKGKVELMKLCWTMRKENPDMSFREIGRKLDIHRQSVKKYILRYEEIIKTEEQVNEISPDDSKEETKD
jgi:predicted transcriptional regulator